MSHPPLDRLNAADISALLERFGGHDLMTRGAVNIISLAAIRDTAGDRWARKQPDVWAYVERKLAEHLTYQDLAQRVGDTDYLIAMTSEEGVAAQAVALKVLEEVLLHFLGAAEPRHMAVRAVTSLKDGEVSCAPLDPAFILQTRARLESAPPPRRSSDRWSIPTNCASAIPTASMPPLAWPCASISPSRTCRASSIASPPPSGSSPR